MSYTPRPDDNQVAATEKRESDMNNDMENKIPVEGASQHKSDSDQETLQNGNGNGETSDQEKGASDPAKGPTPSSVIPDGGFTAWYQVFGSFLLFFNCW